MTTRARAWHLLTGLVAIVALTVQLVLVWQGHAVLDETDPPALATRIERFVSYFTILSNVLVAISCLALAAGRACDSQLSRVLRLDAIVGISVTAVVHWLFLRPLLHLQGADYVADKLLHVVVPLLAVAGWLLVGPRGRVSPRIATLSILYPALYMVWTLVHGALTGWYPYPFTDVDEHGFPVVILNGIAVLVLFAVLAHAAVWLDRRLPRVEIPASSAAG